MWAVTSSLKEETLWANRTTVSHGWRGITQGREGSTMNQKTLMSILQEIPAEIAPQNKNGLLWNVLPEQRDGLCKYQDRLLKTRWRKYGWDNRRTRRCLSTGSPRPENKQIKPTKKWRLWGSRVAQSIKCLPSTQVLISESWDRVPQLGGGSLFCGDSASPSASAPPLLVLSLKWINTIF